MSAVSTRGLSKEAKRLIRQAVRQGWRARRTGGGHIALYAPDGETMVTIAGTPAARKRSMKNALAMMKRAGFDPSG